MKLTIISHTEHYKTSDGQIVGLSSTVTEINNLISVFDNISHVGMLHKEVAPSSALPYSSHKITFIPISAVGGPSVTDKLSMIWEAPKVISIIKKSLKGSDYFQFRAPTGIGVFVIPYLIFLTSKNGWFKYAGNWKQTSAPWAYHFQKWLLKNQSRTVTINGFWDKQPKQCLSFENPCLTKQEIETGQQCIKTKTLKYPVEICFIGRMETAKGVGLILDALAHLDIEVLKKIKTIHLVGDGTQLEVYKKQVKALSLPVVFHGYLSRNEVHKIYIKCHAIILPSASEGFPKVVAEAMNYGCIPIVSNVSSIGHYIRNNENGFLLADLNVNTLTANIIKLVNLNPTDYKDISATSISFINQFSYQYYNQRIKRDIL